MFCTCHNMNEPCFIMDEYMANTSYEDKYSDKWKKPDTQGQRLYDATYMR